MASSNVTVMVHSHLGRDNRETIPEAHLAANLPSPVPTEFLAEQLLPLELEIHPDEYRVRGRPHPLATVQSILAYTAEHDKNVTVIIKTSQQAPAKRLVTLLDACNRVGLHDLNVVALGK